MKNSITETFKNANVTEAHSISVVTNDSNNNVILKIEWDHFDGSVLEMQEDDFVYDKFLMIADEEAEVRDRYDYAHYRTNDKNPQSHWSEIATITKTHLEKLEKFRDNLLGKQTHIKPTI